MTIPGCHCERSEAISSEFCLAGRDVAVTGALQTADGEREESAERQHQGGVDKKTLAGAEAVGECAHYRRDQDRAEPLAGLAQTDDRALLMAADGARLHRQDDRLDHPF